MLRSAKILIFFKRDHKKKSYESRNYETVDEKSQS